MHREGQTPVKPESVVRSRHERLAVETSPRNRTPLRIHLRLATCRNLLMRESRAIAARWGLTLPQFDVLAELARDTNPGGFTFAHLSRLLLVTSGNLTGIVDRLEEQELVRREPDQQDRRVVRVRLTDKGVNLTNQALPHHADEIQRTLSFMPRKTLAQLCDLLGLLRDGLHDGAQHKRRGAKALSGAGGLRSDRH